MLPVPSRLHGAAGRGGVSALVFVVFVLLVCSAPASAGALSAEETYEAWMEEVKALYEKAKEAGEKVPADVATWFREEVRKVNAWEYRVVEMQETFSTELEGRLNELGSERWEVIWIDAREKRLRIFLKRRVKSYLRNIPTRDLLRLMPSETSAAE